MDPRARRELYYTGPGLFRFNPIARNHRAAHVHDPRSRGVCFGGQDADLAENLARLAEDGTLAPDGEEVAGLDLIVVAEVDRDEIAFAEGAFPSGRRDDEAAHLAARVIAERGKRRNARERNRQLRPWLQLRTRVNFFAGLRDDRAGVVLVGADDLHLSAEVVVAADERVRARVINEIARLDDEVDVARRDAGRGAAADVNQVAHRDAVRLLLRTGLEEHFDVFERRDVIR